VSTSHGWFKDPLVQPVATNSRFGVEFLDAVEKSWPALSGFIPCVAFPIYHMAFLSVGS